MSQVWLSIFVSVFAVIGTMTLFTRLYNYLQHTNSLMTGSTEDVDSESNNQSNNRPSIRKSTFTFFGSHMIYVINTMTNQGRSAVLSQLCGCLKRLKY